MEASRNLLFITIVFMLIQYARCNYETSEYKSFPEGLNVILQEGSKPASKSLKLNSRLECAIMCMNKRYCQIWSYDDGNCQIFNSMKDKVTVEQSPDSQKMTYYETRKDWNWIKMYSVKKGSGFTVADSFLGKGDYKSWGPAACTKILCDDLFRSFLIDIWNRLPIKKVRLSLTKNDVEVLSLIFNGQGTNSSSWFKSDRLLNSTWEDIVPGSSEAQFYVVYKFTDTRAFYITETAKGCVSDSGWLAVTEQTEKCQWGQASTYPQILYSNKKSVTNWHKEHPTADALALYVSF